jgi:hypothetical protein
MSTLTYRTPSFLQALLGSKIRLVGDGFLKDGSPMDGQKPNRHTTSLLNLFALEKDGQ